MSTHGSPLRVHRGFVLFVGALVLFELAVWNARIGNGDSWQQLRSTIHLVDSGQLSISDAEFRSQVLPPHARVETASDPIETWTQGEDGSWYQIHDPGNKALMAPAAFIATRTGRQPSNLKPTATTKVLASASIVAFGVLLPVFLFLALSIVLRRKRAMRWAALGLVATILLPYSKATWDVFPCAVVIAAIAWWSLRRLQTDGSSLRDSVVLFAFAGLAGWFRFSLAPFLFLGCALVEYLVSRRYERGTRVRALVGRLALGAVTFAAVLVPVFIANERATGNPFKPPTALYKSTGALFARFPLTGVLGLLASPNRGLLLFSPLLVVALATAWLWRGLPAVIRSFVLVWGIPVGGYLLAVGSIRSWGSFGWGPRYLVPVIPLVWIPTAYVGARAMDSSRTIRAAMVALICVAVVLATIPTLTNWHAVESTGPDVGAQNTRYPKQILETARYTGRRIPVHGGGGIDAGIDTKEWPDLAALYAARKANIPDFAGYLGVLTLLAGSLVLFVAADRKATRSGMG